MAHRGAIFAVVVAALLVPAMGQGRGSGPPAAATTTASDEDDEPDFAKMAIRIMGDHLLMQSEEHFHHVFGWVLVCPAPPAHVRLGPPAVGSHRGPIVRTGLPTRPWTWRAAAS